MTAPIVRASTRAVLTAKEVDWQVRVRADADVMLRLAWAHGYVRPAIGELWERLAEHA